MAKYRPKGTYTIEAMQFPGTAPGNIEALIAFDNWLAATPVADKCRYVETQLMVKAETGSVFAAPGSWVLFDASGITVLGDEEFIRTYELADDGEAAE